MTTKERMTAIITLDLATLKSYTRSFKEAETRSEKINFRDKALNMLNNLNELYYSEYIQLFDNDMKEVFKSCKDLLLSTTVIEEKITESAVEILTSRIEKQCTLMSLAKDRGDYREALQHQKAAEQLYYALTDIDEDFFQPHRSPARFYAETVNMKKEIKEINND